MTFTFPKRLIASFLLGIFALILLLIPKTSFAQTTSTPSANLTPIPAIITPQSPNSATLAIYNFGHAVSCILIGQSAISPCLEYKIYRDAQGVIKSIPVLSQTNTSTGVLGMSLSMMGEIIGNPPIKTSEYIAHMGEEIGVKSAYAQVGGSGGSVLSPIFKLWEVSRNMSYIAMIIVFVLVGLMVMFRQKLNPQTVVSVQLALPGLVIGLVMITFSYFLAALISDLAFVGTNIVGYYFSLADPSITTPTQLPLEARVGTPNAGREENALTIFSRYTGIINSDNIKPALDSIWPYLDDPNRGNTPVIGALNLVDMDPQKALSIMATMLALQFIVPFGGLAGGWGQAIAAIPPLAIGAWDAKVLVTWSLSWVAMIALIYSMFRLLLRLINNLLSIIFLTIAAPFYFLAASLPGRQNLATTWLFNMLCNVLAFPAVFAVFYFVVYILGNDKDPLFLVTSTSAIASRTTFPLLGGLDFKFLNVLLAFGALLATPSIPDMICKAVGKPSALGGAAAGAIGGAIASGQRYQGQASGGIGGLTQRVGNLRGEQGWITRMGPNGRPVHYRPAPILPEYDGLGGDPENKEVTSDELMRSGSRPGRAREISEGVRSLWRNTGGRLRRP